MSVPSDFYEHLVTNYSPVMTMTVTIALL